MPRAGYHGQAAGTAEVHGGAGAAHWGMRGEEAGTEGHAEGLGTEAGRAEVSPAPKCHQVLLALGCRKPPGGPDLGPAHPWGAGTHPPAAWSLGHLCPNRPPCLCPPQLPTPPIPGPVFSRVLPTLVPAEHPKPPLGQQGHGARRDV